jgi:dolichol-phosphate mannosyltransferase
MMLRILSAIVDVPCEILVIYDSLDDNSIPVVKKIQKTHPQIKSVQNKLGKGIFNAIKAGINNARGDYIFITAADDIGPVMAIEDMLELMRQGCKLVSCTRYAHGGRVLGGSAIGRPLSKIANKLFYWTACSALTDSTIGIKMFDHDIFNQIKLESEPIGFAFAFELAIKAQIAGMKLGEVPIVSLNRLYGKSSFAFGTWVKEYSKWFLYGLKNYNKLRKNRKNVVIKIPLRMMKARNQ